MSPDDHILGRIVLKLRNSRRGVGASLYGGMLALLMPGCQAPPVPYPAALQADRPAERIRAIKHAAETRDLAVVGLLVDRLEDDDAAVRFYAILALEKLTGTRQGYDYADDDSQRGRAVTRWRRYLTETEIGLPESGSPPDLTAGPGGAS